MPRGFLMTRGQSPIVIFRMMTTGDCPLVIYLLSLYRFQPITMSTTPTMMRINP